jgi:hypothetical protein
VPGQYVYFKGAIKTRDINTREGFVMAGGIFVHQYKHKLLGPMSRSTVVASAFLMIGAPRVLMGQSEAPDQLEEITITAEKI